MASYINGITTYIPQIQPSDVNLQIESQYANMRQSKHDAARQQISNLYGSLLNSPLSREDNNIARDNFFKTIEGDIKRISGMDLSLQQNVTQAQSVFNQLLDDKYILKDMAWTKNFQNQVQISDYLKNVCTDSAECDGQWWDGGDRLLQYQMEDFQNATADDSLRMSDAHYIAKQDVTRMALDFAKQYDVDMTLEQGDGKYIFTQKNGQLAAPVYSAMLNGMIAQNPKVMEYYNAKARVQRLDYMHQHAEEFGSMEAAEQDYINKMLTEMSTVRDDNGNAIQSSSPEQRIREDAENAKTQAERKQAQAAGLQVTASQIQDENKSAVIAQSADKLSQQAMFYEREYDRNNNVVKRINRDANNQTVSGEQIDSVIAKYNMDFDIGNAVMMASLMKSSVTMREDKYGLERYKASLAAQQKQQQSTDEKGEAAFYAQMSPDTKLGGTQIDENVKIFEQQTQLVQSNWKAFKEEAGDKEFNKAVAEFYNSDAYRNLSDEQKRGLRAAYLDIKDVQSQNLDLGKDIIQPLFTNVSDTGLKQIEEAEKIIDGISANDQKLKEAVTAVGNKIANVKTKYSSVLDSKMFAMKQAADVAQYADAMDTLMDSDNPVYKALGSLARAFADGKIDKATKSQYMTFMHAGNFGDFVGSDNDDFFIRDGKDEVKVTRGQLLGLIETSGNQNSLFWDEGNVREKLINELEKNGIKAVGKTHTAEDKALGAFEFINNIGGIAADALTWLQDISGVSKLRNAVYGEYAKTPSEMYDTMIGGSRDVTREEDFVDSNGNSIFKKDKDGKRIIENGKYVLADGMDDYLNEEIKIKLRYKDREEYINHNRTILDGKTEFDRPVNVFGIDFSNSSETTMNFSELTEKMARKYQLLQYNGNAAFGFDTNGQLAVQAATLTLTNNEDTVVNQTLSDTFSNWTRGNQSNNLIFTTQSIGEYQDAKANDKEFRDWLDEHGILVNEFLNNISVQIDKMAGHVKYKKDGTPMYYDEDGVATFTYSPMALGNPEYSVIKVDPNIMRKALKASGNLTEEDMKSVPALFVYNHHSQAENAGDSFNGYSLLDNKYKHSVTATIVDTMDGEHYHGLYLDRTIARDIEAWRDTDRYQFQCRIPVDVNNDGSIRYELCNFENNKFELNDGFDLAWERVKLLLNNYYMNFYASNYNKLS